MKTRSLAGCWLLVAFGQACGAELYVARENPQASDANPGTKQSPLRTLGRACEAVRPGDTVFIGRGVYPEVLRPRHSGTIGNPIRFLAQSGEEVTLTGAEPLCGSWRQYRQNVYALETPLRFTQLFWHDRMMPEARWPNTPPGELMNYRRGAAGEGTGYEVLADPNLPPGDWNGGMVLLWPGSRWVSGTRRITDYRPGRSFRFDRTFEAKTKDKYHASDPYKPVAGNPYLLTGSLAGLDAPGEWFLDEGQGTVYFWTPDGKAPAAGSLSVKQRECACDLSGLRFIEVKGFMIFGAGVSMNNSENCLLEDCRLRYVEHFRECGLNREPPVRNVVTGKNNQWRRCLIAYAASSALRIGGENNRLLDSIVHDANYLGTGRGGIDLGRSVGGVVSHCSIFRTGRDTIQHHGSKRVRIEYCDIYHTNLLNNDSGAIYCWGTDGEGGVIAYNWVHDNLGDSTVGIYLDNFSKNFLVHHNLVWNCTGSGIRLNSDAINHMVCHNTVQQVREPFGTYCYAKYTPTMQGTRIINNLVNAPMHPRSPSEFVQGELGPQLQANGPGAVDRDGRPTADSKAVDAGVVLRGISDGFVGKAPDLGAYELGVAPWVAGADWQDPDAPPSPSRNLAYRPRGPVTAEAMITDGLVLWLDAADPATLDLGPNGTVQAWRDKSSGRHVARPVGAAGAIRRQTGALGGKPALRGNGGGKLRIDGLRRGPGSVTVLVVSQAADAAGPSWQRIAASFDGTGQEWVLPNWMIGRPGGEKPAAYPPRLFIVQREKGAAIGRVSLLGASASDGQGLAGDIAEVLVFDRQLRFDEIEAIQRYLKGKWAIAD